MGGRPYLLPSSAALYIHIGTIGAYAIKLATTDMQTIHRLRLSITVVRTIDRQKIVNTDKDLGKLPNRE